MTNFVWVTDKGVHQKLPEIHDKHLLNIIKKLYKEARREREEVLNGTDYTSQKQKALTSQLSDQDFAHRLFPELDVLLREVWRRGLVQEAKNG